MSISAIPLVFQVSPSVRKERNWEAQITIYQLTCFSGYYLTKDEAIKARIEGERKYRKPILNKKKIEYQAERNQIALND